MDIAIEETLQAVYNQKNIYDGYDSNGYLQCFEAKMKSHAIPEYCLIKVFEELVIPKLQESIQVYARKFVNDWEKFSKATIRVGDDHMDQEIEKFELEKKKCEKNVSKNKDTFNERKMQERKIKGY